MAAATAWEPIRPRMLSLMLSLWMDALKARLLVRTQTLRGPRTCIHRYRCRCRCRCRCVREGRVERERKNREERSKGDMVRMRVIAGERG